jgi:hypothetical protein
MKEDPAKDEIKSLEGTWTVTALNVKEFDVTGIISAITIKGDKLEFKDKDGKSLDPRDARLLSFR